jgi:hypothetical protein
LSAFDHFIADGLSSIRAFAGRSITYRRGTHFITFCAVKGSTTFDSTDQDGVAFQYVSTDFIFDACDLVLNDEATEPKDNDLIVLDGDTYQVSRPGGSQSWRYSDTGKSQIRVHTKLRSKGN